MNILLFLLNILTRNFCLLLQTVPPRNAELQEVLFTLDTDEPDGSLEESYLVIDEKGSIFFSCSGLEAERVTLEMVTL